MNKGVWLKPVGSIAIVCGVATTAAGGWLASPALTPETRAASSVLAELAVSEVPGGGVTGFGGSYGSTGTPDLTRATDTREGDFADPDGVRDRLDVDGGPYATTEWARSQGKLSADAGASAFRLHYQGFELLRVDSVISRAHCFSGGDAVADVQGAQTHVLRRQAPTMVDVSGADMGMPAVDTARLAVSANPVERTVTHTDQISAEAYLDIRVNAELRDHSGEVIHNGRLLEAKLAHVKVGCSPEGGKRTPFPSVTSPGPQHDSARPANASADGRVPHAADTAPAPAIPRVTIVPLGLIVAGLSCVCLGALLLLVFRHRRG